MKKSLKFPATQPAYILNSQHRVPRPFYRHAHLYGVCRCCRSSGRVQLCFPIVCSHERPSLSTTVSRRPLECASICLLCCCCCCRVIVVGSPSAPCYFFTSYFFTGATDSTIAPPAKPAILFNERSMAARHKEGYNRKKSIHMISCGQRSIDR